MRKVGQVIIASIVLAFAGSTHAGESYLEIYEYLYGKKGDNQGGNGGNGGNGGGANGGGAPAPMGGMGANGGMGPANGGMGPANGGNGGNGGGPIAIPELDSIGAPIALALVAGIGGIALERRRRQNKK